MNITPQKLVPALISAIRILRYVNQLGKPAGVSQISHALGINPSTCFNILKTLAHERLLVFDANTKHYGLGLGLVELAHGALDAGFVGFIHPRLEEMATRFGVTALLWQDAGQNRFVLVDKAESSSAIRVHLSIGQRFPALIGAFGRCVAAQNGIGKEELRKGFAELRWENPPDFEDYWRQVEDARRDGFAMDRGNFNTGITTVAAVIPDQGGDPLMAISTIGLSTQFAEIDTRALSQAVRSAAREISAAIGGGKLAE